MLQFTEGVYDRNSGVLGDPLNRGMREGAQDDYIHPALQVMGYVTELFARSQALRRLIDEEGDASKTRHAGFEGEASAQRGFFKEHHELFASQSPAEIRRTSLHQCR